MSGKNTTNIDTQREYYNAAYFNQSGISQIAKYEVALLKPFFTDPDRWKLAINRFRVPLSGIPLTSHNIPFEMWQVGLGYLNGVQTTIELAYVPQFNPVPHIDSGNYDIYTFQEFLDQINSAFQTVFTEIKASAGSSYIPTEAPRIVYNGTTKFFSIIVEGVYAPIAPSITSQFQIFMNQALWNMFFFPSNQVANGNNPLQSILVQNNGINAIQGSGSATLPQFLYVQQETSTIYQFNDLTRLIIGTMSIPVSGDGEGTVFTNTGTTTNKSINMITDIIPDTSTTTNDSPIIYIPNGILRWYNLYAQQPFTKVDLIFYYETKDGIIQQLSIPNGEYFSCKLEFKRSKNG